MKKYLLFILLIGVLFNGMAFNGGGKKSKGKESQDSITDALNYLFLVDSVEKSLNYQTGKVSLSQQNVSLNIPEGFKYLNAEQTKFVLNQIFKNPKDESILGSIWPAQSTLLNNSYIFTISYEDLGYIKDEDAKDTDYDELLKNMKESVVEGNKERLASGYQTYELIGWAKSPFYDEKQKVLHWAKEVKFGDDTTNVLNYEVRILGRKGVLSLTAISTMNDLPLVNSELDKVLSMASFTEGNKYSDFDSSSDRIAEYTIGGLIAGKVLAKVGFFALIAKFGKIIVVAVIAFIVGIFRKITGKGKEDVNNDENS
jgi:uncharacterized membrane-anchored protein